MGSGLETLAKKVKEAIGSNMGRDGKYVSLRLPSGEMRYGFLVSVWLQLEPVGNERIGSKCW